MIRVPAKQESVFGPTEESPEEATGTAFMPGATPGYRADHISKAAPVVIVESEEAERDVRELYEGQPIRIVRRYKGSPAPAEAAETGDPGAPARKSLELF